MNARHFLTIAAVWIAVPSACLAANPPSSGKAKSEICTPNPPTQPSQWMVTDAGKGEYDWIRANKTTMTLQPPNASGEWQITFSNDPALPQPPPSVNALHFIRVCGGTDVAEMLPHPNYAYIDIAYLDIMKSKRNYYAAMGLLDGVPTLALLTMSKPGTQNHRHFNLVFVKAEQAKFEKIRQGGVIHGQEN